MLLRSYTAAVCALFILSSQTVTAAEGLWIYAKGTDTLPENELEFKITDIIRFDKDSGDYTFHDIRPEFEYGITNSLTFSAEFMIFRHDYSVDDSELNPMYETQGGAGQRFSDTQFAGYELNLAYNVLSPYKDLVGLTFTVGYEHRDKYRLDGADIDQDSFVGSVLIQKDFFDDTLITVFNLKTEFERRKSPGVLEEEIAFDWSLGVSYRFAPKWFGGLEFRHQSDYLNPEEDGEFNPELDRSSFDLSDFRIGSRHQYGAYLGPTIHYAEQKWWLSVGLLWQVSGGGSQFSFSEDGRNWDEHERRHLGISFGYEM